MSMGNALQLQQALLSDEQFQTISTVVHRLCGINLHPGKKELVKARLTKRLRRLGLDDFDDYIEYVRSDPSGDELTNMLDALCTTLTHFFREEQHFDHLENQVLPELAARRDLADGKIRFWSAGCASGEEAYSMAITVAEHLPNAALWDVGILATDLSSDAIRIAQKGVYEGKCLKTVPPYLRAKYFDVTKSDLGHRYRAKNDLRSMMHFARLNLMDSWPMRGEFDVIFCRNVMIYFDKATQADLIHRFWRLLRPGGTLFTGHSESLTGIRHNFRYVRPTIYQRP
ncbi:MAG: hypothetical protein GWP14_00820 [Actinobacteria bacterium]|nr:hypothetical protein [Actinomycetota bacterium]